MLDPERSTRPPLSRSDWAAISTCTFCLVVVGIALMSAWFTG